MTRSVRERPVNDRHVGTTTAIALHWGRVDAEEGVDRLSAWLSDDELDCASGFRFDRDRRRFIVRRGRLREMLAAASGGHPAEIGFSFGPFGKPRLAPGLPCFSASHSGDFWAVAIGADELGLDIERIDPAIDHAGIAASLFAPGEREALAALTGPAALNAFFACWTRKEAFVKAIGRGLSYPLESFEVSLGTEPALLDGGDGWRLLSPRLAPGLSAAIALKDDGGPVALAMHRH